MASTNQSPFYKEAESKFLQASTNEEKLKWLEEMIKECPKHKSSEKMLSNLKRRYIKLKEQLEKNKKKRKSSRQNIKKDDMQLVIISFKNSGKSSLLSLLTNLQTETSDVKLTTSPLVGMMNYDWAPIQIIENPAVESEYYDRGLTNTADTVLVLVESLEQIDRIKNYLEKAFGEKIIAFNKIDNLSFDEKRKISATLQSKKYNFVLISVRNKENIDELKKRIFQSFKKIRIFTKEPGKEKSKKPIIMKPDSTVREVAEKILKGFSKNVKETKIWGPSSKFPGQKIGQNHKLKDMDVVEFKTN